ncbi:hypothetical protein JTB14_013738 [Gonioctena quinquepunctata]|nr:hypothetical protein JTB14_013738 [Gonioctena quinquepunctata]
MNTDDFEKVQTRKQKRNQRPPPNKTIGQGEETNTHGFKGAVPKAWMYVYRVLPEVETNHIKSYLKEKLGEDEEYLVKELPSQIPQKKMLHDWCKVFQQGSDICPQLLAQRGRLQTF